MNPSILTFNLIMADGSDWLGHACGMLGCLFLGVLAIILLWKIATNDIDLQFLVSEKTGHASMSRFQLLIFSFIIGISILRIVEKSGTLPDIPNGVLVLLGISASTYAVGKGIQTSEDEDHPVQLAPLRKPKDPAPNPQPPI